MKTKTPICAICGEVEATTRNHIPPKELFFKPLTGKIITVPACKACNGGASTMDEPFRADLGLLVGNELGIGQQFFKNEVVRTFHHNRRLQKHIARETLIKNDQDIDI